MTALLALDQGTTSSRAIVFSPRGDIIAVAQREFAQHFPQSGWVEHDASDLWVTQRDTAAEAIAKAGLAAADIAAIGITNQRETTLLWDRNTGEALHRAIVWQDRRTATMCDKLKADGLEPVFTERTGLLLDPYFSGTKLAWLLDNVPGARARAERGELAFGTVDTWLIWHLTQGRVHATDVSNASRTLMLNLSTLDWDDTLLAHLRVPRAVLPKVMSSADQFGETHCDGLPTGLRIAGVAGDQQAALFGQRCEQPGMAKNTYGTGCFMLMNTGAAPHASKNRLLSTVGWRVDGRATYAVEGSVFVAGAVVQWLRDGLGLIRNAAEIESLAASVPDTGDMFIVPAFTGLGAPYWDANARGVMIGLTRGTTRAHIARAALESIALQSVELARAMEGDSGVALSELRVDGGATANNLLMQLQADLLQAPVVRPKVTETTALGAALLAARGVGLAVSDASQTAIDRVFEPTLSRDAAHARLARWKQAVTRSRDWNNP